MDERAPRILVVDDDPRNVRLLKRILTSEGYMVEEAYCGEDALQMALEEPPDLVLLDVMMPGMDGYEVCRRLREDRRTVAVPIVMVTALSGRKEKAKALEYGADDFITKPFERVEILARVRSSLRVKRLHDELMEANRRLEERNLLFETELFMARELQQALMTQEIPKICGVEFDYRYLPTFTVGGDFLFIQAVSESCLGLFISDVMGHGPQAAMVTAIIRTLLSNFLRYDPPPSRLLAQMNERFTAVMPKSYCMMFASAAYLRLDTRSGEMIFSNAGHPPPFLLRRDRGEIDVVTAPNSIALGLERETKYQDTSFQLKAGDGIFMYTDGLFEIRDNSNEIFGLERLQQALKEGLKMPSNRLLDFILDKVMSFAEMKHMDDDLTALCLNYKFGGETC
ncbi:TPA: response regulator [Candidatus Poribacteria bacterium]|nr:response regulator [Candidatus Poribacteria bacterium]